jgi:hypothetical protein
MLQIVDDIVQDAGELVQYKPPMLKLIDDIVLDAKELVQT